MWNLKSIKAENFLSYKEIEIGIKGKKTTLIHGINSDDEGAASNGSGKSSTIEMICFCLTGNSLRNVKNDELIRNSEKTASLTLVLENKVINKVLRIERKLTKGKPSDVALYENDVLRKDLKDLKPAETDKEILRQLEISYNDIINYYLISKEKYTSLLLSSDTQKKEVINRFSKADFIDPIFPKIDDDIKTQENIVAATKSDRAAIYSKIELLEEQIETLKNKDVDDEVQKEIDKLNLQRVLKDENILNKMELNKNNSLLIKNKKSELEALELDLTKVEDVEKIEEQIDLAKKQLIKKQSNFTDTVQKESKDAIVEIKDIIKIAEEEQLTVKRVILKLSTSIEKLKSIEAGEIECPKCKHTFLIGDGELSLEECKKLRIKEEKEKDGLLISLKDKNETIKESEELLLEFQKELKAAEKEFEESLILIKQSIQLKQDSIDLISKRKRDLNNSITDTESSITRLEKTVESNTEIIDQTKAQIESIKESIEEIKNRPNPTTKQIKELNVQIKDQEVKAVKVDKVLEADQKELDELVEWRVYFKKFKSFLANQSLVLIEQQANNFLKKMKSDNQIRIDGFRMLSTGKMKEEISIEISRDGLETERFGKFSGGEKAKVDLACVLSMQTLINSSCLNGGLDMLFCDEILESADEVAMNSIVTSLNGVDKTVFMIAHSQPNENIGCNKIVIEKKNQISQIIN